MHLASAQLLADEVKAKLELLHASVSVESLPRHKAVELVILQHSGSKLHIFCDIINLQCDAIVQRHKNMDTASYADDNSFRGLVVEILNMKLWAMHKWQLLLKDTTRVMTDLSALSLLECHRMWLGHLRMRIREAAPDSYVRRLVCLELLQSKGLVKAAAHGEPNAAGEDLIVAAGAEGWCAEDIGALVGAGADVSTAFDSVWKAASYGNASTLKALLSAGGSVTTTDDGRTALYISAANGHSDCVEVLIGAKADVLQCDK
jgi:hypothetical protein